MKKTTIIATLGLVMLPIVAQSEKKNVLFIAVDDLKPVLGCYGDKVVKTPNIDKLAKQGVVFTNNHCQQAVCAPSRASLMTGTRPDNTKVWDLKTQMRNKNPDIITMPQYFKSQGYFTTGTGKIYDKRSVDRYNDKISWSEKFLFGGDESLYDENFKNPVLKLYQSDKTRRIARKYTLEAKEKGLKGYKVKKYVLARIKPSVENADVSDHAYIDGVIALTAVEKLQRLTSQKRPFFLAVGFKRPHLPFVAPKKYWDMYDRKNIPIAEYQLQSKNGPDLAYHSSGEIRSYTDIPNIGSFSDVDKNALTRDKQRELIHGYYACVSYIDAQIGKLMKALDESGERENTVIVLWGDHGWHLGDHGLWCKHSNFEQATRAPLIFSGAGVKASVNNSPVEFVDIFPTLCEMSGVYKPSFLHGKSLKPILSGKSEKVKDYSVSQFKRARRVGYAFRDNRYRYVVWLSRSIYNPVPYKKDQIFTTELYDYKNDPLEKVNVTDDIKYKKVRKMMHKYAEEFFASQEQIINL